jgi:DNA-binding transcriptional MerR regulator
MLRPMSFITIGEFARLSRLSPKALRLYDELGLLPPARVDPDSGYRLYGLEQLERARLVASLRRIGVPLAEIRAIADLDAAEVAARVAAYWSETEDSHALQRDLALQLIDRLNGKESSMYEVATRTVPARTVLCLERHVSSEEEVWALGKEFVGYFKDGQVPRIDGRIGATFQIYHGEVNDDSDGPIEWCRPVPEDRADEIAAGYPTLGLRSEPAHEEAFIALGTDEVSLPQWQLISEVLHSWARKQHRQASDLGVRVTYLASRGAAPYRPDCDFAVPLAGPTPMSG